MSRLFGALTRKGDQLLLAALTLAGLFHGTLLATGSFRRTYDAYVHIFFADHYVRGWFDTWERRWYTGFTVTSYPPGTHQLMALLSRLVGLEAAFVAVQLLGIAILILGVYRLTRMIGSRRAAGWAALLAAVATGIGEAVHVFGQLPTICSLALLLNCLPFVRSWVISGGRRDLLAAVGLLAGTTALHHVTTLFGAVFFLGPVMAAALLERFRTPAAGESTARPRRVSHATLVPLVARRLRRAVRPLARASVLGALVVGVLVVVVLPYWVWSSTDPIVQIPIPHASRASFLEDPNAGLDFWLIPWGPMLLALPFALWRGLRSPAWPYAASLALLTLLGTGGTTPIPRLLLGGAYDILTLDRFTLWATVLVLPFAGMLAEELIDGGLAARISGALGESALRLLRPFLVAVVASAAIFTVNLTHLRPMQPDAIDPTPIVDFLEKDQHWQWRYLPLGFGDHMAWLSAQTTAQTVDGNYHSARRLPELVSYPVERLEGAKFRGVPGLGSLQQFLAVPEKYHLKYVFSNDTFYDPLLYMSGWRRLNVLDNDVVVWEREDVPPMPALVDAPQLSIGYRLMWGLLPPLALLCAVAATARALVGPAPVVRTTTRWSPLRAVETALEGLGRMPRDSSVETQPWEAPFHETLSRLRLSERLIRGVALGLAALLVGGAGFAAAGREEPGPAETVIAFYDHLDFRRYEAAWELYDPASRPTLSAYLLELSVDDGLVASYASLDAAEVVAVDVDGDQARVEVALTYVTPLAEYRSVDAVALRRAGERWTITPDPRFSDEPAERLARRTTVEFSPLGRRTATIATTEYDDVLDRPELELSEPRVVLFEGRPVVIGGVRNIDADPAALTISAQLADGSGEVAATYNAVQVVEHSLLPGESTPYRVDFQAVPGAGQVGTFHPGEFIAIDPIDDLAGVDVYAAATVTGRGLARPLVVQDLTVALDDTGAPELNGSLLNLGTTDATVTALLISLYDLDRRLIWVDWIVLPEAVRPGLEELFTASLTTRDQLEPVETPARTFANGLLDDAATPPAALVSLPPASGYAGLTVQPVVFLRESS